MCAYICSSYIPVWRELSWREGVLLICINIFVKIASVVWDQEHINYTRAYKYYSVDVIGAKSKINVPRPNSKREVKLAFAQIPLGTYELISSRSVAGYLGTQGSLLLVSNQYKIAQTLN